MTADINIRRIAVVDDDMTARYSLSTHLQSSNFDVVSFDSTKSLLSWIGPNSPVVVISEILMPGELGIEIVPTLRSVVCHQPVIVLTRRGNVRRATDAMKSGAADFLEKPFDHGEVVRAIQTCLQILDKGANLELQRSRIGTRLQSLSMRESQVLQHLVRGSSNKSTGVTLGISSRTVEVYRANVMTKMGASCLPNLMRDVMLMRDFGERPSLVVTPGDLPAAA